MTQAKQGDTVKVHYTGKLEDGSVFETSHDRQPLQFTIGKGEVIPGVEQAVTGMNIGESKTATLPLEEAYGPHRDDMVVTVNREQLPPDFKPEVGQRLEITQENNEIILVTVTDSSDSSVTLDANHPLAGKKLTFELELVGVE